MSRNGTHKWGAVLFICCNGGSEDLKVIQNGFLRAAVIVIDPGLLGKPDAA